MAEFRIIIPISFTLQALAVVFVGVRIARPNHRGLALPVFSGILPLVDRRYRVNITEAMDDRARRAEIEKAKGVKQANILEAEGERQAIKLIHEAAK